MNHDEIRKKNRAIIEFYLNLSGDERSERWKLFSDDATTGLQYSATGNPLVIEGIENIKKGDAFNCRNFPDWKFTNIEIFDSKDPNSFLVECDGEGTSMLLGYAIPHADHYIHKFEFRDGKITTYREYMNPCKELAEMGVEMPAPPVTPSDMID